MKSLGMEMSWILFLITISFFTHHTTIAVLMDIEVCNTGSSCSQCPESTYRALKDGTLMCCPKCAPMQMQIWNSSLCYCYKNIDNPWQSLNLHFRKNDRSPDATKRILAGAEGGGNHNQIKYGPYSTDVNMQRTSESLQVLGIVLEELNNRVKRLENIHALDLDVNRYGEGPIDSSSNNLVSYQCSSASFKLIGGKCLYFSAWDSKREIWQEANNTCGRMSGILFEVLSRKDYDDVVSYATSQSDLAGISFWIGGFYPGISWRWYYDGSEVVTDSKYWATTDKIPSPGNLNIGRCLTLNYVYNANLYAFNPGQCGFEKNFICQELRKKHRSMDLNNW